MIFRLLWRVHELDPARGLKGSQLTKITHRKALDAWLAEQPGLVAELARDELADITRLSGAIDTLTKRISERVRLVAPTLVAMPGCGELTAAKIVGEVAVVTRFRSADALAAYAGVTPIPHWSGGPRTAPVRPGNRQLNRALHVIAHTQCRWGFSGKAYYQKRIDAGRCQRPQVVGAESIIPICGGSMSEMSGDFEYAYDLTLDEARRRTAVLEAIGDDWDPVQVLADEERAWGMLYRGLDDDQQRIYDELVSAGVLPDRAVNRVSD